MTVVVAVVGYGADSLIAIERVITGELIATARRLAKVPDDDPILSVAYRLSEADARSLVDIPLGLSYFLTSYVED